MASKVGSVGQKSRFFGISRKRDIESRIFRKSQITRPSVHTYTKFGPDPSSGMGATMVQTNKQTSRMADGRDRPNSVAREQFDKKPEYMPEMRDRAIECSSNQSASLKNDPWTFLEKKSIFCDLIRFLAEKNQFFRSGNQTMGDRDSV